MGAKSTPAAEITEVEVTPSTPAQSDTRTPAVFGAGLSVGQALQGVLLAAMNEAVKPPPFPLVDVPYAAGMFVPADFQEQEIQDRLPQGKRPIDGVFVGFRLEVTGWPTAYDETATEAAKPCYSVAINLGSASDIALAIAASKAYQFTPKADKGKFDWAEGVGHVRPQLSLLVWHRDLDGLMLIRTPSSYQSVVDTLAGLNRLVDPATGTLAPFPCSVRVHTDEVASKNSGNRWKVHSLVVSPATNSEAGAALWTAYQGWIQTAMGDATTVKEVTEWLNGVDKPMVDEVRAALTKAKALGTRR